MLLILSDMRGVMLGIGLLLWVVVVVVVVGGASALRCDERELSSDVSLSSVSVMVGLGRF